jgi:hypothetical protein
MAKQIADIDGLLMHETEKAYLFAPDGDEERKTWIPKSMAEWEPDKDGVSGTMSVPVWYAEKEGLV